MTAEQLRVVYGMRNVYADVAGYFETDFKDNRKELKLQGRYKPDIVVDAGLSFYIYEVNPYSTYGLSDSSIKQLAKYVSVAGKCLAGNKPVQSGPTWVVSPETKPLDAPTGSRSFLMPTRIYTS